MSKQTQKMAFWEKARVVTTLITTILLCLLANGKIRIVPSFKNVAAASVGNVAITNGQAPVKMDSLSSGMPQAIRAIPDLNGNFRSPALTEKELRAALATGNIRFVLRLNGHHGNDRGPISPETERYIVEQAGAVYVTSHDLAHFDSHAGYRKGRGYVGAVEQAATYFRRGGVLIHCRHGFDRTGALVGAWLAANGLDSQSIITHNGWENYETRGKAYQPYLETVEAWLVK
ncbi:MAG: tyrosine-protein phosphatase, partial [Bacteroidota bacterium]